MPPRASKVGAAFLHWLVLSSAHTREASSAVSASNNDSLCFAPQTPFISLILLILITDWVSYLCIAPLSIWHLPKFLSFTHDLWFSSLAYKSVHFPCSPTLLVCDADTGFICPATEPEPRSIYCDTLLSPKSLNMYHMCLLILNTLRRLAILCLLNINKVQIILSSLKIHCIVNCILFDV